MADRIRLLPEVVANQIAAGEVVNRPSSVVKEMMENALDAGATSVKVNFRDGGKELIQIVDNGCGMSPIDARMAFDRHATSKIGSVEDIYALHTFGFRGEALASIAAVSQVELRTRQESDEMGTRTEINGGQFASQQPVMCPVGSQFFVRNLFYNVPARRRFLDKSTTSSAQIKTEFQRVALCNPQVAFELYANDAPILSLQAASLAGRIVDVVGRHIKQNLLEVDADTSIARVVGYVGRPAAAKKRNTEQYLFVNGRFFRSPYLQSAILRAYEKLIPANSQPSYFLYLTLDPARIDVNVHPQKTEVRFADEEAVWQILHAAVRESLAKTGAVPLMDFDRSSAMEIPVLQRGAVYREPASTSNSDYNPFRETYIDPTAPDPNIDFAGFDVPYVAPDDAEGAKGAKGAAPGRVGGALGASESLGASGFLGTSESLGASESFGMSGTSESFGTSGMSGEAAGRAFRQAASGDADGYVGVGDTEGAAARAGRSGGKRGGGRRRGGEMPLPAGTSPAGTSPAGMSPAGTGRRGSDLSDLSDGPDSGRSAGEGLPGTFEHFEEFVSGEGAFEEIASGVGAFEEIASGEGTFEIVASELDGAMSGASDGTSDEDPDARSCLEFVPSASGAEQQRLELPSQALFSDPLPLPGGFVIALLSGRPVVVDVRRARERIYYENCLRMLRNGSTVSQQLLFPERLEFSADEYALLEEHAVELAALGFDLELCGEGTVEVKGSPADVPVEEMDQLLFNLLQAFSMPVPLSDIRREKVAEAMARAACRGVCRTLAREEAAALLEQLAATGRYSFSPSGKAILAEIAVEDLRAKLG